jgi:hypothetical protein
MIRRVFWLTLGAALGITGYRRALALSRTAPALRARELGRFAGDVREGMDIYRRRQLTAPRRAIAGRPAPGRATEYTAEEDH